MQAAGLEAVGPLAEFGEEVARDRLAAFYTHSLLVSADRILVQVVRDRVRQVFSMNRDGSDHPKLPRASEYEEDMLDLAAHVTRRSRLACQIWLTEELETLTVHIPSGFHNMQGR